MSYHQRLKKRSTSASELEEQKRRMSQMPTIEELERRLQEAEQSFRDASEFLGVSPEEIPVDDGTPPPPPQSVIVSPFYHQLDVTWTEPPQEDHVVRAFLRVRKESDPTQQTTTETSLWGGYAGDLPVEAHFVDAFFEDRWGRRSDWSEVVEAIPLLTAAEYIDLTEADIAGKLGWENLDPLSDPDFLADGIVGTQHIAFTARDIGSIATFYQAAAPTSTQAKAGDLWADSDDGDKLYRYGASGWQVVQDSTGALKAAEAAQRQAAEAIEQAADAVATADGKVTVFYQASAPATASIGDLWLSADSDNRLHRYNGSEWVAVDDKRIADALAGAQTAQATADGKIDAYYQPEAPSGNNVSAGDLWYDTDGGNLAHRYNGSEWTPLAAGTQAIQNGAILSDKIASKQILASLIASHDAAAFNLWAENAMIESAKIKELSVDKLTAGTFTAGQITLAGGGALKAGQSVFDSGGITLAYVAGWKQSSDNRASKLTSVDNRMAIGFINDDTVGRKGIGIRAEGNEAARPGAIYLNALQSSADDLYAGSSAWIHILAEKAGQSVTPQIYMGRNLHLEGILRVTDLVSVFKGIDVQGRIFGNKLSGNDTDPHQFHGRVLLDNARINGSGRGLLSMTSDNGKEWHIWINNSGQMQITGTLP